MKTILLIFIFALSLNADSMFNAKCVDSAYIQGSSYYIKYSDSINYINVTADNFNTLISNFDLFTFDSINNTCILKSTNYNYLGLTEEQFNISMAFYGIFLSSLIAFGLIKAF